MRKILTSLSLGLILPILGAAAAFIVPSVASAAGGTLYVGHGSTGNNKSCASPGYNSVQAAVDAANSDNTVYLCGGQFAEQVFINKSITLTGDRTSGLTAVGTTFTTSAARFPSQFTSENLFVPQALLVTTGNVTVSGLTISGLLPGNGGCAEQEFGVLALAGNIQLLNDKVLNIADSNSSLDGCQFGVAIQVGREYWPVADFSSDATPHFAATANLVGVTVSGYAKNGITVDGQGSRANVTGANITGFGPTGLVAQNGLQISRGATGNVTLSNISNNSYTGAGETEATGILIFGGCGDPLDVGVTVTANKLTNNDIGVSADNYNAACNAPAATPTRDNISTNFISDSAVTNTTGNVTGPYQAGIEDVGNNDNIVFNLISGDGYATNTSGGAFIKPIDITSFATIHPNVFGNSYDGHLYNG